jgi:hypothetical protein
MANPMFTPTADQLRAVFDNSMWYEVVYTFGVPDYDPRDYCQWEVMNFCRLAHARLLYDFLETPKNRRRDDDVLAEDFGYPAQTIRLTRDDRERLNKDLLHFSYGRLRHTPATKPWPSSILSNLLDPVLQFMRFIRDSRTDLIVSKTASDDWNKLIESLESGRELRITSWMGTDNVTRYVLRLGNALPHGKPILTELCYAAGTAALATSCSSMK